MELFFTLLCYSGILTFCFWLGGRLHQQLTRPPQPPTPPPQAASEPVTAEAPPEPVDPPTEPEPSSTEEPGDREPPLEPEVLPDPQQAADQLARNLEGFAEELASRLGVDLGKFGKVYTSTITWSGERDQPPSVVDLEEFFGVDDNNL